MPHFLGIDVGTSATKALILAPDARLAAAASAPHPCLTPRPGWSEQRPDDWWTSTRTAVRRALRAARLSASDIAGIGLSGQMHGSVFLDAQRRVLTNAILWNDQRTTDQCTKIERRAGGRRSLIRLVRNVALTGYTAPKILWLRKHHPRLFRRLRTILLPKDYIRLRLTDTLGGDVSDASGTLLFDVARRRWSHALMDRLDLDPALFPPVVESTELIGGLTRSAAAALGLRSDTPVVAGAGDQAASAVGMGIVRPGVVSATIGTSGVVFAHSDHPVPNDDGLLQSFCHAVPGAWCVFGCMLSAGGSLQWARRILYADRLASARTDQARDALYSEMIAEALATNDKLAHQPIPFHQDDQVSRSGHRPDVPDAPRPTQAPTMKTIQQELQLPGSLADSSSIRPASAKQQPGLSHASDLTFLPYLTGERCPYPHPHARAAWIGLESHHSRTDLVRALLEGVTLGMCRQFEILRQLGFSIRQARLAGGAARSPLWRQLQADVYGVPCVRMRTEEGSALGAALLAAVGVKHYRSIESATAAANTVESTHRPNPKRHREFARRSRRAAALYESLEPLLRPST